MRIAQVGTFDVANYGDLLLARVAAARLARVADDVVLISPRGGPPVWEDCDASRPLAELSAIGPSLDGIVLGGGNIVHAEPWNADRYDVGGATGLLAYPRLWFESARVALTNDIPLCWNAPGAPRSLSADGARLLAWAAHAAAYVSVRDRQSAAVLADCGVRGTAHVVPDTGLDVASLWSPAVLDEEHARAFAVRSWAMRERTIAIHLTKRYAPGPLDEVAATIDRLCAAADAAPVLLGLGPVHGDDDFTRRVADRMRTRALVVDRPRSLAEVAAIVSRSDLYVGSSLHGMITACAFGVPGMVVAPKAGLHKFDGFLEQFGLEAWRADSWTEAAERGGTLAAAPRDRWARITAAAAPQLDRHWDAVQTGLRSAAPRERKAMLSELEAMEPGSPSVHRAYSLLLPDIARTLAQAVLRRVERAEREDPSSKALRDRADRAERDERRRADDVRELGRVMRERAQFAGRARAAEDRARAAERRRDAARAAVEDELRRVSAERDRLSDRLQAAGRRIADAEERSGRAEQELAALARVREQAQSRAESLELELAALRERSAAPRAKRLKVSVLAWDMGHNPVGRAYLLAEMLTDHYDVELIGPQFARYGDGIWEPLRESGIPMRTFPGDDLPAFFGTMERIARELDGDVLYACKPRLPSFGLAMLAKAHRNRPLILDVDDRELSFVKEEEGIDLETLAGRRADDDFALPFGRSWTQACDTLVGAADRVTVSNGALQRLYGGTVIGHARDERRFDPSVMDRDAERARFGLAPEDRVVLFVGTPRGHKGLQDVARALRQIGDRRFKLVVVGTVTDPGLRASLEEFGEWVRLIPNQPFDHLPATLSIGDLVCVLQDPGNAISRHQIPAKITDAIAMGVPCLATATEPLERLIAQGAVLTPGGGPLHERIAELLADPAALRRRAAEHRHLFVRDLSYGAVRPRVERVIDELVDDPPLLRTDIQRLLDFQRATWPAGLAQAPTPAKRVVPKPKPTPKADALPPPAPVSARPSRPRRVRGAAPDDRYDIVVFWKQNDSGIYGRRSDMFTRYLARSPRVRRVVHFDHQIDSAALRAHHEARARAHQGDLVFRQTLARVAGLRRAPKTSFRTFVHRPASGDVDRIGRMLPPEDEWPGYVAETLAREGVGSRTTVFWVYPRNFGFPALADAFAPDLVVADVTDDHRAWTTKGSAYHQRLTDNYADVLARSDLVLANCAPVQKSMREHAPAVHLVPNACEFPPPAVPRRTPRVLARLPRPLVGYVGNLSSRIDIDLLEHVARSRPAWSLALVGSAHLSREILRLDELPNVHFLGVRPYDEAQRLIREFDVGIIPHVDNEMTRSMNPLKAFTYCAQNVPVVSTDIANLGELADLITVARGRDEFVAAIEAELAAGRRERFSSEAERILRSNSWTQRVDHVLGLMDGTRAELEVMA